MNKLLILLFISSFKAQCSKNQGYFSLPQNIGNEQKAAVISKEKVKKSELEDSPMVFQIENNQQGQKTPQAYQKNINPNNLDVQLEFYFIQESGASLCSELKIDCFKEKFSNLKELKASDPKNISLYLKIELLTVLHNFKKVRQTKAYFREVKIKIMRHLMEKMKLKMIELINLKNSQKMLVKEKNFLERKLEEEKYFDDTKKFRILSYTIVQSVQIWINYTQNTKKGNGSILLIFLMFFIGAKIMLLLGHTYWTPCLFLVDVFTAFLFLILK